MQLTNLLTLALSASVASAHCFSYGTEFAGGHRQAAKLARKFCKHLEDKEIPGHHPVKTCHNLKSHGWLAHVTFAVGHGSNETRKAPHDCTRKMEKAIRNCDHGGVERSKHGWWFVANPGSGLCQHKKQNGTRPDHHPHRNETHHGDDHQGGKGSSNHISRSGGMKDRDSGDMFDEMDRESGKHHDGEDRQEQRGDHHGEEEEKHRHFDHDEDEHVGEGGGHEEHRGDRYREHKDKHRHFDNDEDDHDRQGPRKHQDGQCRQHKDGDRKHEGGDRDEGRYDEGRYDEGRYDEGRYSEGRRNKDSREGARRQQNRDD